jgi:hypothetical protein
MKDVTEIKDMGWLSIIVDPTVRCSAYGSRRRNRQTTDCLRIFAIQVWKNTDRRQRGNLLAVPVCRLSPLVLVSPSLFALSNLGADLLRV